VNAGHPLRWAAEKGHFEVVKELLTNGKTDVNADHPLCWVVQMGDLEVMKELLKNG
jgi:ankyrin repeat protein